MQDKDDGPALGPELSKALDELLRQARAERITPRLRELADRLAQALEKPQG